MHTTPDGASCSASHGGGEGAASHRLRTKQVLKVRTVCRALSQVYPKAQKQQQQQKISNINCELLKGRAVDNSPLTL